MSPVEAAIPGSFVVVGSWTLRSVNQISEMRGALESRLPFTCVPDRDDGDGLPGGLTDTQRMVLVASELVANALEHARPPVIARLLWDGHVTVLDVVDRSPETPPVVPLDREPGEGGHGLRLAKTVADRVGWFCTADGEKHVWAQFSTVLPAASYRGV